MSWTTTTSIVSSLSGAAAALLVVFATQPSGAHANPEITTARPADELRIDELQREVAALRDALADPARTSGIAARTAVEATDTALEQRATQVVRSLIRDGVVAAGDAWAPDEDEATWPGGHPTARGTALAILELGVDESEAAPLWKEAHEQGRLHDLVDAVNAALDAMPETADVQFQRARAYYMAARTHPNNYEGNWWVDSDNAFGSALELDPEHWGARYQRAVNLSFWPTAYGGQASAIEHFETLVEQQGRSQKEARFADTYYWLGNLYAQQGRTDDARAIWARGLREHPDNTRLAKKAGS